MQSTICTSVAVGDSETGEKISSWSLVLSRVFLYHLDFRVRPFSKSAFSVSRLWCQLESGRAIARTSEATMAADVPVDTGRQGMFRCLSNFI